MARPKKLEEQAKTVIKTFRLTPKQAAAFKKLADDTGMSLSAIARAAAIGMKQVYISDELIDEARNISRQCANMGNLLKLHATLLEVIDQNPFLTESDRQEIVNIRELLTSYESNIGELKKSVVALRADIQDMTHGYL